MSKEQVEITEIAEPTGVNDLWYLPTPSDSVVYVCMESKQQLYHIRNIAIARSTTIETNPLSIYIYFTRQNGTSSRPVPHC